MSFNFHILGLFVIYMLMCMYYVNSVYKKNKNIMFNRLLIINFISQLLYLLIFIILNKSSNVLFNSFVIKLFMGSLIGGASILFGYICSRFIMSKYASKQTICAKKISLLSLLILIIDVIFIFILLFLPIDNDAGIVTGIGNRFTYIVSLGYIIITLLYMIFNSGKIKGKDYVKLYIPLLLSLIILIIQFLSSKLGIVASGYTFIILFMYLTLESADVEVINYLKIAKESAEAASVEKTKFLEKMSREIRMPLNTIDGFSQVIVDEDNVNNIKEDVKDIRMASNNLVDLINGIMDISLIETGKMEISNSDYDTMEMLESVSMIAKTMINKKNIDFKVEYSDNIPRVLSGDSEKIKRILINLFNNAVKYTESGSISFKVNAVNSGSMCRLIMSVSDTGKGIKGEELNTIFNRYERVTGNNGSNGLGLAIVKNLVDLMNGKVDVDSEIDKGSIFTVSIDQKVIQSESIKVDNNEIGKIKMFDASGMRVIIVDDNNLNLKVASKLLLPYNVEVVQANSGQEFLDIIDQDNKFDLVLMDDMMPKMSGTETLDIFKKIERVEGIDIPVVVLTANAISGMRDKYINNGFNDYLAKPIDKYELNRVLRKFLKK